MPKLRSCNRSRKMAVKSDTHFIMPEMTAQFFDTFKYFFPLFKYFLLGLIRPCGRFQAVIFLRRFHRRLDDCRLLFLRFRLSELVVQTVEHGRLLTWNRIFQSRAGKTFLDNKNNIFSTFNVGESRSQRFSLYSVVRILLFFQS